VLKTEIFVTRPQCVNKKEACAYRDQFPAACLQNIANQFSLLWDKHISRRCIGNTFSLQYCVDIGGADIKRTEGAKCKRTEGSNRSMEREVKNCAATDRGESALQALYTTVTLYVLFICPYLCN
jgi:hypothetical protein